MDGRKHALRRERLLKRAARMAVPDAGFLHLEAAQIIGERLAATNRRFDKPVLLFDGPFADTVETAIREAGAPVDAPFDHTPWPEPAQETEILPLEPESADLIVSVFDLQRTTDLGTMLLQINHALVADGLFMAALPAEGFLSELRQALITAEASLSNSAAARVEHFHATSEIGNLMQQTGFKLVVADLEERIIRYGNVKRLLGDIRAAGAGSLQTGENPALPGAAITALEEAYGKLAVEPDGRIRASARLAFVTGWKHAAGQQQPLKPGSAAHRLQDYLKSR